MKNDWQHVNNCRGWVKICETSNSSLLLLCMFESKVLVVAEAGWWAHEDSCRNI